MTSDDGYCEIVWIKDGYRLVDAESYERTYSAAEGRTLSAGYYIAQWPPGTTNPHFLHDKLAFVGPFDSRRAAAASLARRQRDASLADAMADIAFGAGAYSRAAERTEAPALSASRVP